MSQSLQGASFHIEHIRPLAKAGATTAENLALACPSCNLHKSNRLTAPDLETGQAVPLYHPRTQPWPAHFAWRGAVALLDLNHPRRQRVREAEARFGLFPPAEPI